MTCGGYHSGRQRRGSACRGRVPLQDLRLCERLAGTAAAVVERRQRDERGGDKVVGVWPGRHRDSRQHARMLWKS